MELTGEEHGCEVKLTWLRDHCNWILEVDRSLQVKVVSISEFAHSLNLVPGKEEWVHISKIRKERINR